MILDRVRHVIEKCMKDPEQSKEQAEAVRGIAVGASVRIPVQVNHSIRFLDISQIIYGETQGRGTLLHTKTGSYEVNQLLGDLEKKLHLYGFFRIQQKLFGKSGMHYGNISVDKKWSCSEIKGI